MSLNIQITCLGVEPKPVLCHLELRQKGCVCGGNSQSLKELPKPTVGYKFAIFSSVRSLHPLHPYRLLNDAYHPLLYTVEVYGP